MDDGLLCVKDFAHVNGRLGLFVRVCQLPEVAGYGADADDRLDKQLCLQEVLHGLGHPPEIL